MTLTPKSLFKFFATAEMFTWAALIAALVMRATVGMPSEVFFVVGASHGFTFLGFAIISKLVGMNQGWSFGKIALVAALAVVPFATLPFERRLLGCGELEGSWRKEKDPNAKFGGLVDSLFVWLIARPVFLTVGIVVALVGIFSFLLWLGPPYEWGK
jgi:integral membrane protein